jgi:hypothetical protein
MVHCTKSGHDPAGPCFLPLAPPAPIIIGLFASYYYSVLAAQALVGSSCHGHHQLYCQLVSGTTNCSLKSQGPRAVCLVSVYWTPSMEPTTHYIVRTKEWSHATMLDIYEYTNV